ncbi:endonuclease iii, putative, partial [Acanthamoeba castellanii str. Neff]
MRKNRDAPVDTMGCEVLAEDAEPKVQRYQTLVALMLSSQTKDQQTAAAIRRLQKHGLTVGNILDTPENELDELISNVGFHRNKAKY